MSTTSGARLQDRVAIITGAGQGIGLAYAQRFLDEGAKVVVAEVNPERAKSAMDALQGKGEAILVETDISDPTPPTRAPRRPRTSSGRSTS